LTTAAWATVERLRGQRGGDLTKPGKGRDDEGKDRSQVGRAHMECLKFVARPARVPNRISRSDGRMRLKTDLKAGGVLPSD